MSGVIMARRRTVRRRAAAPTGPPVTSGMLGWWRGDAGVTMAAGRAAAWADQSGNGNNVSQTDTTRQPVATNTLNGRPVLTFDGTSYLSVPTVTGISSPPFTALAVIRRSSNSADTVITIGPASGGRQLRTFQSRVTIVRGLQAVPVQGATTLALNTTFVVSWRYDGTTSSVALNGTSDGTNNSNQPFTSGGGVSIGARPDVAEFWFGDIAEIVTYNRGLTDSEQLSVARYLGGRWGVTTA